MKTIPKRTRAPEAETAEPPLEEAVVNDDPLALAQHRVVQINTTGPNFGILAQVGEIGPKHLWLYAIRERGAKEFFKVKPSDVIVIGKARVCARKGKPEASEIEGED